MTDMVNHPAHYNVAGRKECIVEMEEIYGTEAVINFCELNAYKYRYRAGLKAGNSLIQDELKAQYYEEYAKRLKGRDGK